MKLFDYIHDVNLFHEMKESGYINVTSHDTLPLRILNYSKTCQIDRVWNEATMKCRGIVIDDDYNIIARPFEKFFNYEELEDVGITPPENLNFDIYEKMDGSLGIVFVYKGKTLCCTRGSFNSEQALHAQQLLDTKYRDVVFQEGITYLFEIIYPEDIHVVTYGKEDDLYLLAMFDNETGEEYNIETWRGIMPVTKHYPSYDWKTIRSMFDENNREGFVVRFSNGFRMKIKFDYYFRLHAVKANLTEKKIFEALSNERIDEINSWIIQFPEETQIWFNSIVTKLIDKYSEIQKTSCLEYLQRPSYCLSGYDTKLDAASAKYYSSCTYPSIVFMLAKHKDLETIKSAAWRIVEKTL